MIDAAETAPLRAGSRDRLAGVLLGTALGDALGLPLERLSALVIARRFPHTERFQLLGRTGYVSDDTEQSALVAHALLRFPDDPERCADAFRSELLRWFLRLPWGIGLATLRSCLRMLLRMRPTGVRSAGNGAAMRAAVLGVYFAEQPERRAAFGRVLAETTHLDPRAVEGALYTAEVAARCALSGPDAELPSLLRDAADSVSQAELRGALHRALELASAGTLQPEAAARLGTSGYVVHTLAYATYCLARHRSDPLATLSEAIKAGGDADSYGAILGAWLGALHGESGLPAGLLSRIHDGPFGPTHLRALAAALAGEAEPPRYSAPAALGRNLALYPVVLAHGFRRLLP
jgi:ADP-ribosylglycohydrolase